MPFQNDGILEGEEYTPQEDNLTLNPEELRKTAATVLSKKSTKKVAPTKINFREEDILAHLEKVEEAVKIWAEHGYQYAVYPLEYLSKANKEGAPAQLSKGATKTFVELLATRFKEKHPQLYVLQDLGAMSITVDWSGKHES